MKSVAIVGFAPSFVDAPFADESIEIWSMNYHFEAIPRVTRIFELHSWEVILAEGHLARFAALTVPIYMQRHFDEIPTSVKYPIELMRDTYTLRKGEAPYFTNTASYMIALAVEEGFEEIQLFGVDMSHDSEYGSQRPSCEFFLGVALGAGAKITTHPSSDILKTAFLYGYEDKKRDWFQDKLRSRRAHLEKMHAHHTAEAARQTQAASEFAGAIQNNDHIAKVWTT